MGSYFFDLAMVAALIIGITATIGVLTNGIGEKLFSGQKRKEFVNQSNSTQTGWNTVGGKGIYKKKTY